MNNTLEGINSRITELEEQTNDCHITEYRKKNEKKKKEEEDSLRDHWGNTKGTNIHIIWVPEVEERGAEKIFEEIIAEKFHNIGKEIINQVQEAHSTR